MKNKTYFNPKINIADRYSLYNMTKRDNMTVDEFKENIRLREQYKQDYIKKFMDNGMNEKGATLQTLRIMNGCG